MSEGLFEVFSIRNIIIYKKLLTMLSLCKKHKIYLLVQTVNFSNSDKKVRWPKAAAAASNV